MLAPALVTPAVTGATGGAVSNWIALASVVLAAISVVAGVLGTLRGVRTGVTLTQQATERQRLRQDVELALVKCELALDAVRLETLTTALYTLAQDDLRARLQLLRQEAALAPARDALAVVRVRHPDPAIRELADTLDVDLSWTYPLTARWFALAIDPRSDPAARDHALEQAENANESATARWRQLRADVAPEPPSRS